MAFGTGTATEGTTSPVNEVIRKAVTSATNDGGNIEWTAEIEEGDFSEETYITEIYMVEPGTPDRFLGGRVVAATLVDSSHGLIYKFQHSVSAKDETDTE